MKQDVVGQRFHNIQCPVSISWLTTSASVLIQYANGAAGETFFSILTLHTVYFDWNIFVFSIYNIKHMFVE